MEGKEFMKEIEKNILFIQIHCSKGLTTMIRFKFPKQKELQPFDLIWYDGGMKPAVPDELGPDKSLPREGMRIVGNKGKILAGFRCEEPQLIPESSMTSYLNGQPTPKENTDMSADVWIDAFKNKTQSPGKFFKYRSDNRNHSTWRRCIACRKKGRV
jgi:hypothetical protein